MGEQPYRPYHRVENREHKGTYTVLHHSSELITVQGVIYDRISATTYAMDALVRCIDGNWSLYGGTYNNGKFWHDARSGIDDAASRCRLKRFLLKTAKREASRKRRADAGKALLSLFSWRRQEALPTSADEREVA